MLWCDFMSYKNSLDSYRIGGILKMDRDDDF